MIGIIDTDNRSSEYCHLTKVLIFIVTIFDNRSFLRQIFTHVYNTDNNLGRTYYSMKVCIN